MPARGLTKRQTFLTLSEVAPASPATEPSPAQLVALTHVTRQQLWARLADGPSTISELSRRLAINKGNVAHHLAVLERVGLVGRGMRRTVRGGTEQHFERTVQHLRTFEPSDAARQVSATAMASVSDELEEDPDPHLHLRHLRLTAHHAEAVARHLDTVLESLAPATAPEQEYGVLVALWRRPRGRARGDRQGQMENR